MSDKWKHSFRQFEANPKELQFSGMAFVFGLLYYLAKGVWKKGMALTAWLLLLGLVADIIAAALGYAIPDIVFFAVSSSLYGMRARHDIWRKQVHGETWWPHPAARWSIWATLPGSIAVLALFIVPPTWLALPACGDRAVKGELLGLIRSGGPIELDDRSWRVTDLTNVVQLDRRPFPETRHCHTNLELRDKSGEKDSYGIEFWLHLDPQGELRISVN